MISAALSVIEDEKQRNELAIFYEKYKNRFYNIARSKTNDPNESEDAVQEAFTRIANKPERFFYITSEERLRYVDGIVRHHGLIVLVVVVVFQIWSVSTTQHYYDKSDGYYHEYCNIMSSMSIGEATDYSTNVQLVNASSEEILGLNRAISQLDRLCLLKTQNIKMFYQTGYNKMLGVNGYSDDMGLALMCVIVLCVTGAPLIAYDNLKNTIRLIFPTKKGKRNYLTNNIIAIAIYAFFTSIIVNGIYFIYNINFYGDSGITSSIQTITGFEDFADISILEYIIFIVIVRSIIVTTTSVMILFISNKCKSVVSALVISLSLFALPIMIYLAGLDFAMFICIPYSINRIILS